MNWRHQDPAIITTSFPGKGPWNEVAIINLLFIQPTNNTYNNNNDNDNKSNNNNTTTTTTTTTTTMSK